MADRISVRTEHREQLLDITGEVRRVAAAAGVREGTVHLWSMHTTCALTVNEGFDPDVVTDVVGFMQRLVPQHSGFLHAEGNSDSHIKVSMFGPGLTLILEGGELVLGQWQRVFLCEWDGPRIRTIAVHVQGQAQV